MNRSLEKGAPDEGKDTSSLDEEDEEDHGAVGGIEVQPNVEKAVNRSLEIGAPDDGREENRSSDGIERSAVGGTEEILIQHMDVGEVIFL